MFLLFVLKVENVYEIDLFNIECYLQDGAKLAHGCWIGLCNSKMCRFFIFCEWQKDPNILTLILFAMSVYFSWKTGYVCEYFDLNCFCFFRLLLLVALHILHKTLSVTKKLHFYTGFLNVWWKYYTSVRSTLQFWQILRSFPFARLLLQQSTSILEALAAQRYCLPHYDLNPSTSNSVIQGCGGLDRNIN